MTQDEIKMAKEAGFTIIHGEVWTTDSKGYQAHNISKPLNKFTELILASQAQPTSQDAMKEGKS